MAVDKILVHGIELEASIGVLPSEHVQRQTIEIDVDVEVDTSELLCTGDLSRGVDFRQIAQVVTDVCQAGHFELVESLADRIASELFGRTVALTARVQVRKRTQYVRAAFAGVEVFRVR